MPAHAQHALCYEFGGYGGDTRPPYYVGILSVTATPTVSAVQPSTIYKGLVTSVSVIGVSLTEQDTIRIVYAPSCTEESDENVSVLPAAIGTLAGPVVPANRVLPIIM